MIKLVLLSIALLLVTEPFRVTVSEVNTTRTPINIILQVPHDKQNDIACAGINDKNDYTGFPESFLASVCWNVNLNDFPDIPETFYQRFPPLETAGVYYAGAVLYMKSHGGDSRQMKVANIEEFIVTEAK